MDEQNFERDEKLLDERRLRRLEQKRRRQLQQRIVLGVLAVILILTIVLIVRGCQNQAPSASDQQGSVSAPDTSAPETPAAQPDTVITLAAVGDIMVYDEQISAARQSDGKIGRAHV